MKSEEIFYVSGPFYLTNVDWNCKSYRRSVIASLVRGVYILEHDRQEERLGDKSVASPWWEFFHFQLHHILEDSKDLSIFGAILELKLPSTLPKGCALNAPKYVIAFRGTLTKPKTSLMKDLFLDLNCITNTLDRRSIFKVAMHSIQKTVDLAGAGNVWLAGHSLGSAIALVAGRNMAKMGYFLQAYLFNSPFTSAPLERIDRGKFTQLHHFCKSVTKACVSVALNAHHEQNDPFAVLSTWVPHLFVNPADRICSGYVTYFALREMMYKIGAAKIENIATKTSLFSTLLSAAFDINLEPFHLLPSAELIVNMVQSPGFRAAHGIQQWWDPRSQFQSLVYRYG